MPTVLGAGVGTAAGRIIGGDEGLATAARSAPGLGTRRIIWSADTDEPVVALTFDDGPDPEFTPHVLDVLAHYDVRATFMLVGARVDTSPDLVRRAVADGHELGNHTYTHPSLAMLDHDQTMLELERTAIAIDGAAPGVGVRWFRPPRGILTGAAAQAAGVHGYDTVMWSRTRGPSRTTSPSAVADYVNRKLDPGTIVLLHDSLGAAGFDGGPMADNLRKRRRVEMRALPRLIETALDHGVRFAPISHLVTADTQTAAT